MLRINKPDTGDTNADNESIIIFLQKILDVRCNGGRKCLARGLCIEYGFTTFKQISCYICYRATYIAVRYVNANGI